MKKKKSEYVIKESKDFATNHNIFLWLGYLYDGSFASKFRLSLFVLITYTGPIHHFLPVISVLDENESLDTKLMGFYLTQFYVLLGASWPFMITRSQDVINLGKTVRKGFFHYSEPFTTEERTILSRTNDSVVRMTRFFLPFYFVAGFSTYFKELSFESFRQRVPPYPGVFPWNTDTDFKFGCALIYHLGLVINTTHALEANFLLFYYFTIHYEGQFHVLIKHFNDTFPRGLPASFVHREEYKQRTLKRLKDCVQHHMMIKEYHQLILSYFGVTMFFFRIVSTLMICILCYFLMIGVPAKQLFQLSGLAAALLFLLVFCLRGESIAQVFTMTAKIVFIFILVLVLYSLLRIRTLHLRRVDFSEEWTKAVYEVEWWDQPIEVQKTVLMMQLGANRPLKMYGLWKVIKFSHEGIAVIGQESLAFFNMLRAMK